MTTRTRKKKEKVVEKRQQVVEIVDRNIKIGSMGFERLYKILKSETGYKFFKDNGYTDDLLEQYVRGLGLTFEMSYRGLDDWRTEIKEGKENQPIKGINLWEKIVKEGINEGL